jgi:phospholipid/cholesterol/gamma-HCH transport system substrate-binding protein
VTKSSARTAGIGVIAAFVLALGLLIALRNGTILISQRGALGGVEVKAEFTNAAPLVSGQTVRVDGAIAGTVQGIELTDHGSAMVTMRLLHDIDPPRADATASIRQLDLLGDSYVSLSPGRSAKRLSGPIPTSRTIAMPRLDELFSTFR